MVPVKQLAAVLALGVLFLSQSSGSEEGGPRLAVSKESNAASDLFAQSAAQVLTREFVQDGTSFILLDGQTGAVLAASWDQPAKPIPLGSLVKPFTALAYAQDHGYSYPKHVCKGTASGCWLPRGHGTVTLSSAIAHSCNSYFRMLTADMDGSKLSPVAQTYGLDSPGADLSGPALSGLGNRWLISPLHMAQAYLELSRRREQPGVHEVIAGMAQSARQGTGAEVGQRLRRSSALVKTGTAACTHARHAPGDGFVVALAPAEEPRFVLLVRVHGVPGAKAAATAGRMLQRIEEQASGAD